VILVGDSNPVGIAVQHKRQRRPRQRLGVVLLAQVSSHHVLEPRSIQLRQQRRSSSVVKMAEPASDPPFQMRGIATFSQHVGVVIAFQHQRLAHRQHLHHVGRDAAGVGQYPQATIAIREHELRRFAGIVWHGKRLHLKVANGERQVTVDHADHRAFKRRGPQGAVGQENIESVAAPRRQQRRRHDRRVRA